MSLHRSLKTKPSALNQHRNVLTRAERIAKLTDTERFTPGRSPLGLLKVANRLVVAAKRLRLRPRAGLPRSNHRNSRCERADASRPFFMRAAFPFFGLSYTATSSAPALCTIDVRSATGKT